jgi:hypothetical protein
MDDWPARTTIISNLRSRFRLRIVANLSLGPRAIMRWKSQTGYQLNATTIQTHDNHPRQSITSACGHLPRLPNRGSCSRFFSTEFLLLGILTSSY